MVVFALRKWAKFNELTRHLKLNKEFPARTQPFTRQSVDDPTQHEVVALDPWYIHLWLVDVIACFSDLAPTTVFYEPTSVPLPPYAPEESIATLRHFFREATSMLTDLTKLGL
jgi:hypothetical protein